MKEPLVYMDYAATTPVDPRVVEVMSRCLTLDGAFANPASTHRLGRQARELVHTAREQVAQLLGCEAQEIVWTSGATESDNLAIKGVAHYYQGRGRHIVTSRTEHKAVLDTCGVLEQEGFEVTYLEPDSRGRLDPASVESALRSDTTLVSIMHVNNEIGVIQDIEAIGTVCRRHSVLFHVDGAQSVGRLPINLSSLPVDLLSLCAHKIYGPKGIGALYVRRRPKVNLEPIIHGGGHQLGYRSGTLATHQIVGLGTALQLAGDEMDAEQSRLARLKQTLWEGLKQIPNVIWNGGAANTVAGILNVSFPGVHGKSLHYALKELIVSAGAACTSASPEPSYVLRALGLNDQLAQGSIRFSLGRFTTETEVHQAIDRVTRQVSRLRSLAPEKVWPGD